MVYCAEWWESEGEEFGGVELNGREDWGLRGFGGGLRI